MFSSESSLDFPEPQLYSSFKLSTICGIVSFEALVVFRNPAFLIVSVGLLALCQFLTPDAADPYAVVTVNGLKPLMTAGPMMVCIAVLLGIFLFPVYVLLFGSMYRRERSPGMRRLYLSSPISVPPRSLALFLGKLLASMIVCIVHGALALTLCSISIHLRTGLWPGTLAVLCFVSTLLPVAMLMTLCASSLGVFFPATQTQVFATGCVWIALLMSAILSRAPDLFGIRFIGRNVAPGDAPAFLSVGFLKGPMLSTPWTTLHYTQSYLYSRCRVALVLIMMGPLFAILLSFASRRLMRFSLRVRRVRQHPEAPSPATLDPDWIPDRWADAPLTSWKLVPLVAGRLVQSRPFSQALIMATLLLGLLDGQMRLVVPVSLLIPLAVLWNWEQRGGRVLTMIEHSTPSLWRPTPRVVKSLALALLTAAPTLTLLGRRPIEALSLLQFVVAIISLCGWLTLSGEVFKSEIVALASYILVWYGLGCTQLPKALDIFALQFASSRLLLVNAVIAIVMYGMLARADRTTT